VTIDGQPATASIGAEGLVVTVPSGNHQLLIAP
jgi:hypothetical protein